MEHRARLAALPEQDGRLDVADVRISRARAQLAEALGYGGAEVGQDPLTLSAIGNPAW